VFFLSVPREGRNVRRRIEQVWESDGTGPYRLVFDGPGVGMVGRSELVTDADLSRARGVIDAIVASGARRIEDVRAAVVAGIA